VPAEPDFTGRAHRGSEYDVVGDRKERQPCHSLLFNTYYVVDHFQHVTEWQVR